MTDVLIAEDEPEIAALLTEEITERLGASVRSVANGVLAYEAIAAQRPDLLVLDVGLPGLSGLDVFDLVRNDPRLQGVPVLFLTASPERAATAFAPTGVHRVMAKPFDVDRFVAAACEMTGVGDRAAA